MIELIIVVMMIAVAVVVLAGKFAGRLGSGRRAGASSDACGCCPIAKSGSSCGRSSIGVLAALLLAGAAQAADTIECYPKGALDAEMYLGSDGLGKAVVEREVFAQGSLGLGLTDRFSAYVGMTSCGDGRLGQSDTDPSLGFIATPLIAGRLSGDLACDVSNNVQAGVLEVSPVMELNFDAEPDQASWGLYLRNGVCLAGRSEDGGGSPAWSATVGAYRSVWPGRQVLVELGASREARGNGHAPWRIDQAAVGCNVAIAGNLELVTEVRRALPGAESGSGSFAVTAGVIAGLPIGR